MDVMHSFAHKLFIHDQKFSLVEFLDVRRNLDWRRKHVPADIAYVSLDIAFLVSCIRIAEPAFKAIMNSEAYEDFILLKNFAGSLNCAI